jgi:tetratricopeptide (TPR) repeat protein
MKIRLCIFAFAPFVTAMLTGCASDNSYNFTSDSVKARNLKEADVHEKKGADFFEKSEYDKAIEEFNEAIRINPDDALSYFYRGLATGFKGDTKGAISDFDEAVRLNPNYTQAYEYRGIARAQSGNFKEAVTDFKKVIELDPKSATGYSCLAALRATCKDEEIRNGAEAIQAATEACELTDWKVALHIHRLAAAYADSNDWEKAVSYEQKAMNVGAATAEEHNRMIINLSLYENHLPFRDPTIFQ